MQNLEQKYGKTEMVGGFDTYESFFKKLFCYWYEVLLRVVKTHLNSKQFSGGKVEILLATKEVNVMLDTVPKGWSNGNAQLWCQSWRGDWQ